MRRFLKLILNVIVVHASLLLFYIFKNDVVVNHVCSIKVEALSFFGVQRRRVGVSLAGHALSYFPAVL